MQEIRDAATEKLEELNEYPFKRREGNRNTAYLEEEMSFMKPLPLTPYESAVWSTAKVQQDYLIADGKNVNQFEIRLKSSNEIKYGNFEFKRHPPP